MQNLLKPFDPMLDEAIYIENTGKNLFSVFVKRFENFRGIYVAKNIPIDRAQSFAQKIQNGSSKIKLQIILKS